MGIDSDLKSILSRHEVLLALGSGTNATKIGKSYKMPLRLSPSFFSFLKSTSSVSLSVKKRLEPLFTKHKGDFVSMHTELLEAATIMDFFHLSLALFINGTRNSPMDFLKEHDIFQNDFLTSEQLATFFSNALSIPKEFVASLLGKLSCLSISAKSLNKAISDWKLGGQIRQKYTSVSYIRRSRSDSPNTRKALVPRFTNKKPADPKAKQAMRERQQVVEKITHQVKLKRKTFEQILDECDPSQSGKTPLYKYQIKLKSLIGSGFDEDIKLFISFLDKNKDAEITREELTLLVGNLEEPIQTPKPNPNVNHPSKTNEVNINPAKPKPNTPIIAKKPTGKEDKKEMGQEDQHGSFSGGAIEEMRKLLNERQVNPKDVYNRASKNGTMEVTRLGLLRELKAAIGGEHSSLVSEAVREIGASESGYVSLVDFTEAFATKPNEDGNAEAKKNEEEEKEESDEFLEEFWSLMDQIDCGIDKIFCEIDTSRDGVISLVEMRTWLNFKMADVISPSVSSKIIVYLRQKANGRPLKFSLFSEIMQRSGDSPNSQSQKAQIAPISNPVSNTLGFPLIAKQLFNSEIIYSPALAPQEPADLGKSLLRNSLQMDLTPQRLCNVIQRIAVEVVAKWNQKKTTKELIHTQEIREMMTQLNMKVTPREQEILVNLAIVHGGTGKNDGMIAMKFIQEIADEQINIEQLLPAFTSKKSLLYSALGGSSLLISKYQEIRPNYYKKIGQFNIGDEDFFHKSPHFLTILNSEKAALRVARDLVIEMQKNGGTTFTDNDFGPIQGDLNGTRSIYFDGEDPRANGIHWARLTEISPNEKPEFFLSGGAKASDVVQGELQDCYFLAALALIAQDDKLIRGNFDPQVMLRRSQLTSSGMMKDEAIRGMISGVYCPIFHHFRKYGLFVFRFFKNYKWRYVIIDDRLPCRGSPEQGYELAFAKCRTQNEFWVPLIEKAYAKIHGSYEAIELGDVDEALYDLTGFVNEKVEVVKKNQFNQAELGSPDDFWEDMKRSAREATLMGCSIREESETNTIVEHEDVDGLPTGLIVGHAYAILDIFEMKSKNKTKPHRLLRLLNPWGDKEWTGKWSDNTEELQEMKGMINQSIIRRRAQEGEEVIIDENDGIFFMNYKSWRSSFTHYFRVNKFPEEWSGFRIKGEWNEENSGGTPQNSKEISTKNWEKNPHYEITVKRLDSSKETVLFMTLGQGDTRLGIKSKEDRLKGVPSAGFTLIQAQEGETRMEKFNPKRLFGRTKISSAHSTHMRKSVSNGRYFLVPATLNAGVTSRFLLNLYFDCSKEEISVKSVENPDRKFEIIEEEEEAFSKYDEDLKLILRMKASKAIFN